MKWALTFSRFKLAGPQNPPENPIQAMRVVLLLGAHRLLLERFPHPVYTRRLFRFHGGKYLWPYQHGKCSFQTFRDVFNANH
jgi:hypothetical protein